MFADYLARYYVDTYHYFHVLSTSSILSTIVIYRLRSLEELGFFWLRALTSLETQTSSRGDVWLAWEGDGNVKRKTRGWNWMSHLSRPVAMDNTMKFKEIDSQEVVWCMRYLYLFTLFWHPARQEGSPTNSTSIFTYAGGSFSSKTLERPHLCSLPW